MQARTPAIEADAALLWPTPRARRPRKARVPAARAIAFAEPQGSPAPARRPARIRPALDDALELALFVATLAATALLHLGALALVW